MGYHDVPDPPEPPKPGFVIHPDQKFQTMAGFGASSAWTAPTMSANNADFFFSVDKGIGLSLLRIQIKPWGETTELDTVDLAVARGVAVWGAPWSPPPEWKTNNSTIDGGELLPERYQDWADRLADFAEFMDERGTPMFAISAQNEPGYKAYWDTCMWDPEDFADFIFDHLAPALDERKLTTKILAPETQNWGRLAEFADPILDREEATQYLYALAAHGYDYSSKDYPRGREAGLQIWQTEVSDENHNADPGMGSALRIAGGIFDDIELAHASAWHHWWLFPRGDTGDTNAALFDVSFAPARRAYAVGQFSKFVRPGFVRVGVEEHARTDVRTLAFEDPESDRLVLVLLNGEEEAHELSLKWPKDGPTDVEYWLTDETHALARVREWAAAQGELQLEVPARSVSTLVIGLGEEEPPEGEGGFGGDPGHGEELGGGTSGAGPSGSRPSGSGPGGAEQ